MADPGVAVVTGGSSGIGRALVERLAREGWRVYTMSRPSDHYAKARAAWGAGVTALEGDVASAADLARLVDAVRPEGKLDLLVNNAGAYFPEDGAFPPAETLAASLGIHVLGPYRLILACLDLLGAAGKPVVVNVSSGAASLAFADGSGPLAYRTSKAALNMLTRSLAHDLAPRRIAIHAVDPGWVRSRLNPAGAESPESAVDGFWWLLFRHDPAGSGGFWRRGERLPW